MIFAAVALATAPSQRLNERILSERCLPTQFAPVRLGMMSDSELVLEWFFEKGRIQFFIDAELDDSLAVYLDGTSGGHVPEIENVAVSISNLDEVSDRAVKLAKKLA